MTATDAERAAARDFAVRLCADDEAPSRDVLAALAADARELPAPTQTILAGMAGVADFALALGRLEVDDLAALRTRFSRMGV